MPTRSVLRARCFRAVDAAVPALGGKAGRQVIQARELQQLLGNHHDSVVARTVLLVPAATARVAGHDTFSYGLLDQSQVCQAAKIEQTLPRLAVPAILHHYTVTRLRGSPGLG